MDKIFIAVTDPRAVAVTQAIQTGDTQRLHLLLQQHKELVLAYVGCAEEARSLLHLATDWPGHFPNNVAVTRMLIEAGCRVNSSYVGKPHSETPLHWAASCDDVQVMELLLDSGADINAGGGIVAETPLANARAFLQLKCAHRLVERGATVTLQDAATLRLIDGVKAMYGTMPCQRDTDCAFWNACHGSQILAAQFLHGKGAQVDFIPPWGSDTPLDEAMSQNADELVKWLKSLGATTNSKRGRGPIVDDSPE